MSRTCAVTGKRPSVGNNRSHSLRATKRRYLPNLQTKKVFDPKTGKYVKVKISAKGLKTLNKTPRRKIKK